MYKPVVAIVGKPNVGKSSFFNRVIGKRVSIVEDTPGVTRDRVYCDTDWAGHAMTLIDTGGIEPNLDNEWQKYILMQAQLAIDVADVVVFIIDGKQGITPDDQHVAMLLRKSKKPIVLAVNKMDNLRGEDLLAFYELGLGEPIGMSCSHGLGVADVLDAVVAKLSAKVAPIDEENRTKIAIVGRPNAGKSSITNRLLGEERVITGSCKRRGKLKCQHNRR